MNQQQLHQIHELINRDLGTTAATVFSRAMTRTLDEALIHNDDDTVFVLTGDIPAMWLRDSAAQMRPYLTLAAHDSELSDTIAAVVRQQMRFILRDPYANAFNQSANSAGHQGDHTQMTPWIWERKYEVDSLAFPLQLAHQLWRITGRKDHCKRDMADAGRLIIQTLRTEQDHPNRSSYRFQRDDCPPSDTLINQGDGSPVGPTGMTWSAFRPSDDACHYHYNVPGNLFAAASLRNLAELASGPLGDESLAHEAEVLAGELEEAVYSHGVVPHPIHGEILAYEVDGLGNALLMDDANMPSLLSLPLTGAISADDPLYQRTRAFVLSSENPTFAAGSAGAGVGSPHTPEQYIWPIAMAVQGLTSSDALEKRAVVQMLLEANGERGRMCESYHVDDPSRFTREWFSWADSMFCELVLDIIGQRSPLLSSLPEQS